MKKSRPSILLSVLTDVKDEKDIVEIIMKETPTLGIRRKSVERHIAEREIMTVSTSYGDIKVKLKKLNGKLIQINPEYEDCAKLAKSTGIPLHKIYEMVDMEALEIWNILKSIIPNDRFLFLKVISDYMDNKCLNIKSFEKKATKFLTYQLNPIRNLLNILQEIEINDHSALNKNDK